MDKPIESYRYQRKCSLSRCKKDFGTNLKNQKFCESAHRIEYHEARRKAIRSFHKRLNKLRKDLEQIASDMERAIKKAAKEARNLADLLSLDQGGENSTEREKESNG